MATKGDFFKEIDAVAALHPEILYLNSPIIEPLKGVLVDVPELMHLKGGFDIGRRIALVRMGHKER